jgi:hypothetical protein
MAREGLMCGAPVRPSLSLSIYLSLSLSFSTFREGLMCGAPARDGDLNSDFDSDFYSNFDSDLNWIVIDIVTLIEGLG